jgi:hypothetical protein
MICTISGVSRLRGLPDVNIDVFVCNDNVGIGVVARLASGEPVCAMRFATSKEYSVRLLELWLKQNNFNLAERRNHFLKDGGVARIIASFVEVFDHRITILTQATPIASTFGEPALRQLPHPDDFIDEVPELEELPTGALVPLAC